MIIQRYIITFTFIGIFAPMITIAAPPPGATPEDQGQYVFITRDKMDTGYTDALTTLSMTLLNAAGQKSNRKMLTHYLEVQDDGDKTLITFKFPRDIKGTGLLTFEHVEKSDDQWLYLPALKRVKRIVSKNKSGSFVGSEFSYEDIASTKPEKYTYSYKREDEHQGTKVWIIERYPKDPNSGYTKIISWVDQSNFQLVKQEYFDRKGSLLKFSLDNGNTLYLEKFWRPSEIIMENLQSKKKTILTFNNWAFRQDQEPSFFSKRSLERQR
tara:strand:- start:2316 stop:3122 length:807 start_codon:yes stop_codon:yes gene_type:complete